jgi:menaquinone-dependent protoporphyrinogen oxidase
MGVPGNPASKHEATSEIARMIGQFLAGEGIEVDLAEPDFLVSVAGYEAVVAGSATSMGRWLEASREFIDRCSDDRAARPVWVFSSRRVFAGKLDRSHLRFGEKAVVTACRAPEGDFRPWDDIRARAEEIVEVLRVENR